MIRIDINLSESFEETKGRARRACDKKDLPELAAALRDVVSLKSELEEKLKRVNAWYEILRIEAIPDRMESEGLASPVRLVGIGTLSLTADLLMSVTAGRKPELLEWLENHELGDYIVEDINAATLKSLLKRRLSEGLSVPDEGLVRLTPVQKVSLLNKTKGVDNTSP